MSQRQAVFRPPALTARSECLSSTTSIKRTSECTPGTVSSPEAEENNTMEEKTPNTPVNEDSQITGTTDPAPAVEAEITAKTFAAKTAAPAKPKVNGTATRRKGRASKKLKKQTKKQVTSSSDDSSTSTSNSSESDESVSSSDDKPSKRKRKGKGSKARATKKKHSTTDTDSSECNSSDSFSSSDDDNHRKAAKAKKTRELKKLRARIKALKSQDDSDLDSDSESSDDESAKKSKSKKKQKGKKSKKDSVQEDHDPTQNPSQRRGLNRRSTGPDIKSKPSSKQLKKEAKAANKAEAKRKKLKGTKLEFVRVDRLWDYDQHAYITRETRADTESGEYDEYVFNVRRIFNWDNKHTATVVDIKSKPLKAALIHVMGIVKGISLAEETPSIDPNMIFLYLEELRTYMNELKEKARTEKKKKVAKEIKVKRKAIKVLVKYLDKDYDETKKTLYPMLESGTITFDLLWALFKSNEIVYAPTYNTEEVPRAFKVDYANLQKTLVKGEYYEVEGKYLDYNGTIFGKGGCDYTVEQFKGPRKISTLSCYPIKYHRDHEALCKELISRGKEFVALKGMLYKLQKGMAFHKKPNGQVVKVNVDGRVMVDPANFRRINPNYNVSTVRSEDPDLLPDDACCSDESEREEDGQDTEDDTDENQFNQFEIRKKDIPKMRKKLVKDSDDEIYIVEIPEEHKGNEIKIIDDEDKVDAENFTEEEYLIASPVALGFSFSHKMWMEFDIAGLKEIQWNEGAFESLVIPHDQKDVVKALVESHSYSASKNIDDVIQGKGQGLVAVLHGPPGTGKTLTAEGIAELLKKPLYMVSVGELGIKGGDLEKNFSQIIDIAHCWGALLLLDEADVFLEKRELHDISRNALVSIFLRLLEYFQGILFLTTNRVVTFDEAFASRIHIGLRYGELSLTAKKNVWKLFIEKVRKLPDVIVDQFSDEQYAKLSQYQLNGREIKNSVRTAQSLATIEKVPLSMEHLLKVLFVGNVFAKDLKGSGYEEALKFYM